MPYLNSKYTISVILLELAAFLLDSCNCSANNSQNTNNYLSEFSSDTLKIDMSLYEQGNNYIITDTIDLHGKTLYLPADVKIVIRGGLFKNGCIVGNNTPLKYNKTVFDSVHIKGSWLVPCISTEMFKSLSYDNSLKDVLALANSQIQNNIKIEKGLYQVTATKNSPICLNVESNTELKIDGTIKLTPNDLTGYSILNISGKNISISGKGSIVGDKFTHTGTEGEWGMGICVAGGENISIYGLKIENCWGDCIYIRRNAKDVVIEDCTLDNGRRQGISIISAQNVLIKNCTISNIGGANPAYAIDVEPNQGDQVRNVEIINVEANNCRGGFECNGSVPGAEIDSIKIRSCIVANSKRWPLRFIKAKSIIVDRCKVNGFRGETIVLFKNINEAYVRKLSIDGIRMKHKDKLLGSISTEDVHQLRVINWGFAGQ